MTDERQIYIEGSGLLPPSSKPIYPAGIKDDERIRVHPPVAPSYDETRYWRLDDAYTAHPNETTFAWKNDPQGLYGRGRGIGRLPDPCMFQFTPKKRALPDLWRHGSLFVVSARLLDVFREVDPDAFEVRRITMMGDDGVVFDETYHFLDVIRTLEVVDYANSTIIYGGGGCLSSGQRFDPFVSGYPSVRLLKDLDLPFHIFRHKNQSVLVSNYLRERVLSMRPKARNVDFDDVASGI
ncbi:imm11 family protein [Allosphingosinicella deserti]|uniref:Immunity MXAN-0049 protein domain-containing protein n=1 Tax=Allosphingosinicella deserti TaxID=2116704 RepID=A0A2P7QS48_9SPHN|nr:DUF1629 domain-containing protein [Sphingomonas deserti]PSJ40784.1 hypothetical protein C7I55_10840 [Sphingomonas deserti]